MPIIAYKTMELAFHHAQARRIACEQCGKPFTFIFKDEDSFSVTGVPLLSNDDKMRAKALKQASNKLRKVSKEERKGQAMCPHCHCYQQWMVTRDRWTSLGCGFLLGGLGLLIVILLANWGFAFTNNYGELILWSALAGAVLGAVLGRWSAISVGPHPDEEDGRAMTDETFTDFLKACVQKDADPILTWHAVVSDETPGAKEIWVSLGLADFTGQPIFPEELDSENVIGKWAT